MDKRRLLTAILTGTLPPAVARVQLRGIRFWAMQDDSGAWDVEVRRHGRLLSRGKMDGGQLDSLRPKCVSWTAISPDATEFIHEGNRGRWPYE